MNGSSEATMTREALHFPMKDGRTSRQSSALLAYSAAFEKRLISAKEVSKKFGDA
jgi:hypothetical protein